MASQSYSQSSDEQARTEQRSFEQLGSLYVMEVLAARVYENALSSPHLVPARYALRAIRDSHEERTRLLADRLRLAGSEPPHNSRIRESLLALLEDAAVTLGGAVAFRALNRGEEHYLKQYKDSLDLLDSDDRDFVERELIPRHISSQTMMSMLRDEN